MARLCGILLLMPAVAFASEASWPLQSMDPDLKNLPSLQNGFKLYTNYCIGCHSLKYQRYERTSDDLGIPHDVALENLVFTGQKIGELMTSSMDPDLAKVWFGAPPPDLTMVARLRSTDWLYTYLKTFYLDDSRPFGVNNMVFENVGMPNVLMSLQGSQAGKCLTDPDTQKKHCELNATQGDGQLSDEEFDAAIYDLVNFLYYTGDPSRLERHRTGIFVLLFLVILYVFTYLLGREYQKEVRH
ncbi:MAG: cytochrome c1 [Gammaproteobacteria bacterium]|nr:cytochrome c1 [Gammaproteobacteria bacterium]